MPWRAKIMAHKRMSVPRQKGCFANRTVLDPKRRTKQWERSRSLRRARSQGCRQANARAQHICASLTEQAPMIPERAWALTTAAAGAENAHRRGGGYTALAEEKQTKGPAPPNEPYVAPVADSALAGPPRARGWAAPKWTRGARRESPRLT